MQTEENAGVCDTPQPQTQPHPPCADVKQATDAEKIMARCVNCRCDVEKSMSRIGGRQLRKLRNLPECSPEKCTEFLRGVQDDALRLHLASMAWWRFSAACERAAEAVRRIMTACKSREPGSGADYMHSALRVLSPLSQVQLTAWFGCDSLYQAASIFSGSVPSLLGEHCQRCGLYKLGCTDYDKLGANECPLWNDRFVQGVASAVKKAGGTWSDPCAGIPDGK